MPTDTIPALQNTIRFNRAAGVLIKKYNRSPSPDKEPIIMAAMSSMAAGSLFNLISEF